MQTEKVVNSMCLGEIKKRYLERGERVQRIVERMITEEKINDNNPSIDLFSMEIFKNRLCELRRAFVGIKDVNHALAVKANPIRGVLKEAQKMGFGLECASYPEAKHSLSLGVEPIKVVFDTPCKTYDELKDMISIGCYINLDNFEEIEKVNRIFKELGDNASKKPRHQKQIGLRINPVVGRGRIECTSTATACSKFGLPLTTETDEDMFKLFQNNAWLQGIHVHVGSQGVALDKLVEGARIAVQFAQCTNKKLGNDQIQVIDIGGGMPTVYDGVNEAYSFQEYANHLQTNIPELFSGKYSLITEFGRSVFVKPGITVTKVEAVKTWSGQRIAVVHVGANQFLRTAYLPSQWSHVMSVFGPDGKLKYEGGWTRHDIAGPMCFSGDYLAKAVHLPEIQAGDFIVIHDTGGYTTSMYSRYNSRQASSMYAYEQDKLTLLKRRETWEEALQFWGLENPAEIQ